MTADGDMVWHAWESYDKNHEDRVNVMFGRADRIRDGEALLIDTGAYKNLVGDRWVARQDKLNQAAGKKTSVWKDLPRPLTLGGVGANTQESTKETTVPISIGGEQAVFQASLLENSELPALLGLSTLEKMNGILDLHHKRLILPKSRDDVEIKYKKGTKVLQLVQAPGGYLMLPCSPGSDASKLLEEARSWLMNEE